MRHTLSALHLRAPCLRAHASVFSRLQDFIIIDENEVMRGLDLVDSARFVVQGKLLAVGQGCMERAYLLRARAEERVDFSFYDSIPCSICDEAPVFQLQGRVSAVARVNDGQALVHCSHAEG